MRHGPGYRSVFEVIGAEYQTDENDGNRAIGEIIQQIAAQKPQPEEGHQQTTPTDRCLVRLGKSVGRIPQRFGEYVGRRKPGQKLEGLPQRIFHHVITRRMPERLPHARAGVVLFIDAAPPVQLPDIPVNQRCRQVEIITGYIPTERRFRAGLLPLGVVKKCRRGDEGAGKKKCE